MTFRKGNRIKVIDEQSYDYQKIGEITGIDNDDFPYLVYFREEYMGFTFQGWHGVYKEEHLELI